MRYLSTLLKLAIVASLVLHAGPIYGQTNFSGLGANDSGGSGFKTTSSSSNYVVSNILSQDGTKSFPNNNTIGGTQVVVIKADGTNAGSFDVSGLTITSFVSATFSTNTKIVFKDSNGDPVRTMTLSANKTLSTGNTSIGTFFDNNATLPVTGVSEIEFTINPTASAPNNFTLVDITLANVAAPVTNTASAIGGTSAGQAVNDNSTISPFSAITVTDADGDNVTATVTLDDNAKGTITGADSGSGPYTLTSKTPAAMQTALRALSFNPTDNRAAVSETTTFTVVVNDGTVDATDNTTTVVSSAVAPSVNSIAVNGTPASNASSVSFDVTFNESVTGVGTSDFSVDGSGVTGSITGISGSGSSYTVTVSSVSGTGTLSIDLNSSGTGITDAGGKAISGGFTAGATHAVDRDLPSVSSITLSGSPGASSASVTYVVAFSESVANVSTDDFTLTKGSTANGTIASVSASSGTSINVVVNSITGTGTLRLDLNGSTNIADAAGNTPPAAFASGSSHTVDRDVPSVSSITLSGSPGASSASVTYVVAFSESVANVSTDDFTLTKGSTANGTIASVSASSGTSINVVVNSITGTGTLRLDLNGSTNIADAAGNTPPAAFTSGSSHTVDRDLPSVSSITLSGSPGASSASVTYVVAFSESVANVSTDDFTLTKGSTANGTIASVSASSGTSINVVVNSITGTGTLRLDLNGSTNIADAAGNTPPAAFASGSSHTVDRDAPTLSSSSPVDGATSVSASGNISLTFSENVAFGTGNIEVVDEADGSNSFTIDVTSPGTQASISNAVLTINPSSDLDEAANYSIRIAATAINDLSGNSFAGITDATTLNFETADVTAPTLQSSSPADGATNVTLSQNLTLTFDDNMVVGTGNITIVETGVGNFEQLDVTNGSLVSISTTTVTLNPSGTLKKGTAYHILIDASALDDDAGNSYAGISDASALNFNTVNVVINEVVTDPQTDWSTNGFNGVDGLGTVSGGTDEWVELFIQSAGIDFTGWTIELNDGSNVSGDLTTAGAFDQQNYVTAGVGTFNNTESGDYLVLGNVDGSGAMNNTGLTINLKDPGGAIVDAVTIGGEVGEAPSGDATSTANESVQRIPNGTDTDTDNSDFVQAGASMGSVNDNTAPADPIVSTPSGAISINAATQTVSGTHSENGVTVHAYADSNNDGVADNTTSLGSSTVSGNAWSFSMNLTADATNNFVVRAVDGANNISSDVDVPTITEDSTSPVSPVVNSPASAVSVNSATQVVNGSHTENGVIIHAYADSNNDGVADNTTSLGSATVASNAWSFSVNLTADASNNFVVRAIDAANNESGYVDVPTVTEDSTNPANPVVTSPASAASVNAATQVISGSHTENGVTVHAYVDANNDGTADNTTSLGSATVSGNAWSFSVNLTADVANNFVVQAVDGAGNVSADIDVSTITEDSTGPTITNVTIPNSTFKVGDAISVTITAGETGLSLNSGSVNGVSVTGFTDNADNTYTATYTVAEGDQDRPSTDQIPVSFILTDGVGNNSATYTTAIVQNADAIDANTPGITSVSIPNSTAKVGDALTVTIMSQFSETGLSLGSGTVNGVAVTGFVDNGGGSYSATYTVAEGNTDRAAGDDVPVSFVLNDPAGNASSVFNTAISQNADLIDANSPTIQSTSPADGAVNLSTSGNSFSITFNENIALGTGTIKLVDVTDDSNTITFDAATGTGLSINNSNELVITPATDLDGSTNYSVQVAATAIDDSNGNSFAGISDNTTFDFTTAQPSLSFTAISKTISENAGSDNVSVSLITPASGQNVMIDYTVTGTATGGGVDHALASGTLTISAGNKSGDISLSGIVDDAIDEDNETVIITLSNPVNASLASPNVYTYTIEDNDPEPSVTLSVDNSNISEASGTATLTATLSAVSSKNVTVTIAYGGTAINGTDYNSNASTSITITAGQLSANAPVIITPVNDSNPEQNETIIAEVTAVSNGTENGTQAQTITIQDDDTPSVGFTSTSSAASENVAAANLSVDLTIASALTVSVDYAISGTATAGGTDYTLVSGTLTFSPGSTSENISIASIVDDALDEDNETVILTLSNPVNANLGTNTVHTYTINDNDDAPTVAFGAATDAQLENEASQDLPIALSAISSKTITVDYAVSGTATGGGVDYTFANGTFTFNPGDQNSTLQLTGLIDDALDEVDETIILTLSNPTNATIGTQNTLTYTITDNDAEPTVTLSVSANSIAEASGTASITATLSAVSSKDVTVNLGYSGTATSGTDYNSTASTSIVITAGSTSANAAIGITATQDTDGETNETIIIDVSSITNGTEDGVQQQTVSIIDDDDATAPSGYSVLFDDAIIGSAEAGNSTFTFAGAEVGATYNYTISSSGGGTNVTGTGTITASTDQVTIADLSGLSDGTLTLSVTLTDPSSNVGDAVTNTTAIDQTAPSSPNVFSVSSDSGSNNSDAITNDNTPDAIGVAEGNAIVEVFVDGVSAGTTTADASGDWTLAYGGSSPTTDGTITITAKATDAAGNISPVSSGLSVTIDTSAPAAPVISSISDDTGTNGADSKTNDNTLSFNGTAEANASLEVFLGGTSIGTSQADGAGQWSFSHQGTVLSDGDISVTAKATDVAGNNSPESEVLMVTIDTSAPAAPTIDLDASFDTGFSDNDDLTKNTTLRFNGTAEANADVEVFIDDVSFGTVATDNSGNWTLTTSALTLTGALEVKAVATDQVGNTGAASTVLTVTIDTQITAPILSPVDNSTDILPTQTLTLTFSENIRKGGNSISVHKSSDDSVIETFDVSSSKVSINGSVVTIDLESILSPATEVYVLIGSGAFVDNAGNDYSGVSTTTGWSFTTIAASTVSSVAVPSAGTYGIGDNLDFEVTFNLPITINGSAIMPITIGSTDVIAILNGGVTNSSVASFRYTIVEGNLDTDGISVGSALSVGDRSSTIKDQFGTDAILSLNNVAATSGVLVDGIKPTPTISISSTDPTNSAFTATFEYDEEVTAFALADINVINGTASDFTEVSTRKKWTAQITPTADGAVSVSLAAEVASDLAGNSNVASNSVSRTFDGTPPDVSSIVRKGDDQLNTNTTSADFRVSFSENVLGVDLTDFELALVGTSASLNTVTQVDAKTYDVKISGISGQGTIGLNLKDDDSIIDNVGNSLGGEGANNGNFTGQFYTTNFLPTDITLSASSISENNSIGDLIGSLTSTDADNGDTHTYSFVAGTGDADNVQFTIDGMSLKADAVFDFETKNSYSIRVKSDDGNGGVFEKALTITVDNVLEASISVSGDASFAVSALGLSQQKTLTITNDGEKPVEVRVASTPNGFSVLPASLVLTTGASTEVTVTFIPTEVRTYSGQIVFSHEGGDEAHSVSGEGAIITSIDDGDLIEADISIYPNPASDILTIDLSELSTGKLDIEIINTSGMSMFTRQGYTQKEFRLNVSSYEMGIYIIQFTNGQSVVRKKVMIKR